MHCAPKLAALIDMLNRPKRHVATRFFWRGNTSCLADLDSRPTVSRGVAFICASETPTHTRGCKDASEQAFSEHKVCGPHGPCRCQRVVGRSLFVKPEPRRAGLTETRAERDPNKKNAVEGCEFLCRRNAAFSKTRGGVHFHNRWVTTFNKKSGQALLYAPWEAAQSTRATKTRALLGSSPCENLWLQSRNHRSKNQNCTTVHAALCSRQQRRTLAQADKILFRRRIGRALSSL